MKVLKKSNIGEKDLIGIVGSNCDWDDCISCDCDCPDEIDSDCQDDGGGCGYDCLGQ